VPNASRQVHERSKTRLELGLPLVREIVIAQSGSISAEAVGARAVPVRPVQRGQRYPRSVTHSKRKGSAAATLVDVHRLGHTWRRGADSQAFSDSRGPDA
jgi:hypothetical protein